MESSNELTRSRPREGSAHSDVKPASTIADGQRIAIVVLGMHRSGTSALTRVLSLLGGALPRHVLDANPTNPAGHWEPEELVNLHDRMLRDLGSRWDDWRDFDESSLNADKLHYYRAEIRRIVEEEYGSEPLIVLKDPRICRFAGLYHKILTDMGYVPRYVLALRNPLDVVASLAKRENMTPSFGGLLWLRHVLAAEIATRDRQRVFVTYDGLLSNWEATLDAIGETLGLSWPIAFDEAREGVSRYLSPELRHHQSNRGDLDKDSNIAEWIKRAHAASMALVSNRADNAALSLLDSVRREFDASCAVFGPATIPEITAREQRIREEAAERSRQLQDEIVREQKARHSAEQTLIANQPELDAGRAGRAEAERQLEEADRRAELEKLEIEKGRTAIAFLEELRQKEQTQTKQAKLLQAKAMRRATAAENRSSNLMAELGRLKDKLIKADELAIATQKAHIDEVSLRVELKQELEKRDREITELSVQNAALRDEKIVLKKQNQLLTSEQRRSQEVLAAIYGSRSWRVTRPIRAMRKVAGQIRAATSIAVSLAHERRLTPATINRGVRRLPTMLKEGKLTNAGSLSGLIESVTPEQLEQIWQAFDADFYLKENPDIAEGGVEPFEHFMLQGWKEGRDPSADFSVSYYQKRYPDIKRGGINPFMHYVLHGKHEKRSPLAFDRRLEKLEFRPKVSVIVPNYNHARYLEQRINSILGQTYENLELIILDDCSTDHSRKIIDRYCRRNAGRVRAIYNERNAGNVFRQWRKGVEDADGDLIWICESDDFCEPDFLEKLIPHFKDRSVQIAFGCIQFADANGEFQAGLDQYRDGAEPGIWNEPTTRPAREWFSKAFGVNNVIANVGGCVFRRQVLPDPVWEEAQTYSVLGDWFLYCHLAGGGQIAYDPSAVAYFRQHGQNTSVTSFKKASYYVEHHRLMALLRRVWGVPDETVEKFVSKVEFQFRHFECEKTLGSFGTYLNKADLLRIERQQPHILIAFLGFHSGGGEVFSINLANALRAEGHLVSMLALDMFHVNLDMAASLDPSIPVYDAEWVAEVGADQFISLAGITLIHSHMITFEIFFFEQCQIASSVPYVVTLHGSYESAQLDGTRLRRIADRVDHWIYLADKNLLPFGSIPQAKQNFTKMGNAMPVDPRPFHMTRDELGIDEETVVFTLVARCIKRKGWKAAIKAFKSLRADTRDQKMRLLLAGDGPELEEFKKIASGDSDITFLGYQSRIPGLYRLSDCALVPTRFEGESFPLCIIEALQAGTPVIGTQVGEIPTMLEQSNGAAGILIENIRDTDAFIKALKSAMREMLDKSKRTQFARVAQLYGTRYDMNELSTKYASIYEKIVRSKSQK